MRGLERDRMANPRRADGCPVFARFLKQPKPDVNEQSNGKSSLCRAMFILVCTSAGEVGLDISADHMVCDLSTFESMAQRLGRVNRFGDGDARSTWCIRAVRHEGQALPARENTLKLFDHLSRLPQSWMNRASSDMTQAPWRWAN